MDNFVKQKLEEWNLSSLADVLEGKCLVFVNLQVSPPTFPKKTPDRKAKTAWIINNSKTTCNAKNDCFFYREHGKPRSFFLVKRGSVERNISTVGA